MIGDIHGALRAMKQVFEAAGFDYQANRLICLGDVADGWPEVRQSFDELLKIKDLVYIIGNHDWWLLQWFKTGMKKSIWTSQGGRASLDSYMELPDDQRKNTISRHQDFLERAVYYHVDDQNRAFVHGGFDWHRPIDDQFPAAGEMSIYTWDRHMLSTAWYWKTSADRISKSSDPGDFSFRGYKEIFIGHTTTSRFDPTLKPLQLGNLWALDQGGGWEGKLTLMDVDTHEYWQSDVVTELYPGVRGR